MPMHAYACLYANSFRVGALAPAVFHRVYRISLSSLSIPLIHTMRCDMDLSKYIRTGEADVKSECRSEPYRSEARAIRPPKSPKSEPDDKDPEPGWVWVPYRVPYGIPYGVPQDFQ